MNVDVGIAPGPSVDVSGPLAVEQLLPGSQRPFPQSVWPLNGMAGTLVQIGGSNFTRFGVVTWVRMGGLIFSGSNGGLVVADDSRLTFTTRAGMPIGQALDVIVGVGQFSDFSHIGLLPLAFTANS